MTKLVHPLAVVLGCRWTSFLTGCLAFLLLLQMQPLAAHGAERDHLLRWLRPPDSDVAGYELYLGFDSMSYAEGIDLGYVPADPNGCATHLVDGLDADLDYYLVMTAYDHAGNVSPFSNEIVVPALDCDPAVCNDGESCTIDSCSSGACINEPLPDGTVCDDGDPATEGDECSGGICEGFTPPCSCPAGRTCNTETGLCEPGPAVQIRINVNGSQHEGIDLPGTWAADPGPGGACGPSQATRSSPIHGTNDDPLFRGEVWGNPVVCRVDNTGQPLPLGEYVVNLYFAETWFGPGCPGSDQAYGARVFDVRLEGETVLTDLDIFAVAGCAGSTTDPSGFPVVRSFVVPIYDGALDIELPASADNGTISAIEILSLDSGCQTDMDCDDGNSCTQDRCNASSLCENTPVMDGMGCDDGDSGSVDDACYGGICQGVIPDCTRDSDCDDGDVCNGLELCDSHDCVAGSPLVCSSSTACMESTCDPASGCQLVPVANGTPCDDGSPFTPTDVCDDGECVGMLPQCTSDVDCSDGDACNGDEQCIEFACQSGEPLSCPPSTACVVSSCDPTEGCQVQAVVDGTSCDDGDAGTVGDHCEAGSCVGSPPACQSHAECEDGNACTTDQCDPLTGCSNEPIANGTGCDDGQFCTTNDVCVAGACTGGAARTCNDGNPCTTDRCDSARGCVDEPVPNGTACSDGDARTIGDLCQGGRCVGTVPECVTDSDCDDANVCNGTERCVGNACVAGAPLECPPSAPCTLSACDPREGCRAEPRPNGTACDDGDASTVDDVCFSGVCSGAAAPAELVRLTGSPAAPQPEGSTITFTAEANGHGRPLEYRWWVRDPGQWVMMRDWNSSSIFFWEPERANPAAAVGVWVRIVGAADHDNGAIPFPITKLQPTTVTANREAPQVVGTPITFTAAGDQTRGPLEYRWWIKDGDWSMLRDWDPTPTFLWTPTHAYRNYRIGVWARPIGSEDHTVASMPFPIESAVRLGGLKSDLAAPQPPGAAITFTASATGNGGGLEYRWWVFQDREWTMLRDWSSSSSFVWTPTEPDPSCKVGVWARNEGEQDYEFGAIPFPIR